MTRNNYDDVIGEDLLSIEDTVSDLRPLEGENEAQYIWRLGALKDSGTTNISWNEISNLVNEAFRPDEEHYYQESCYRKPYQQAKRFYEAGVFDKDPEKKAAELRELYVMISKEKQKLRDERTDYQRSIREQARKESLLELIEGVVSQHITPYEYTPVAAPYSHVHTENDMIVCLSDLHTGIKIDNRWNRYDDDIMVRRLCSYLDQIREIQNTHKCRVCELAIAGDMVSGFIHNNLRLENNENVIQQIQSAIVGIGEFIKTLSTEDYGFEQIRIHNVAGNHSRLMQSKDDAAKGENLDEMIPFCLKLMFKDFPNVTVCEDGYYDESINSFTTRGGKVFYIVHGDKDMPSNVVESLTMMTGRKPDGIIMAHRHTNAFFTDADVKVLQTGCIVGRDNYCIDKRIGGRPEQLVVITDDKSAVKCLYDIGLD